MLRDKFNTRRAIRTAAVCALAGAALVGCSQGSPETQQASDEVQQQAEAIGQSILSAVSKETLAVDTRPSEIKADDGGSMLALSRSVPDSLHSDKSQLYQGLLYFDGNVSLADIREGTVDAAGITRLSMDIMDCDAAGDCHLALATDWTNTDWANADNEEWQKQGADTPGVGEVPAVAWNVFLAHQ